MTPETAPTGRNSKRRRPARLLAGPLAAAIIAIVAVVAASGPDLKPKNFGTVDPGRVYRSGQLTPAAMRQLHDRYGIRTVIDLGSYEPDERGERRNQQVADALGIERLVFDLEGDGTGNPNAYVQAIQIMSDPARQPVLVHCGAGSERTSIACMLYMNLARGTPLEEGFKQAHAHRHRDHRNPRLREVVERWSDRIIRAVREGTQIDDPAAPPLPPPQPHPAAKG
jgi:protein tyrosine phosphatase (PTP) superfamily phosphohydrolase (DUF442 family)